MIDDLDAFTFGFRKTCGLLFLCVSDLGSLSLTVSLRVFKFSALYNIS